MGYPLWSVHLRYPSEGTMKKLWLVLALLLAGSGCTAPTTVAQNQTSGLDLTGVSLDVHQEPG